MQPLQFGFQAFGLGGHIDAQLEQPRSVLGQPA